MGRSPVQNAAAKWRCGALRPAGRSGAGSATGCSRFPIFPARPTHPGSAGGSSAQMGHLGMGGPGRRRQVDPRRRLLAIAEAAV